MKKKKLQFMFLFMLSLPLNNPQALWAESKVSFEKKNYKEISFKGIAKNKFEFLSNSLLKIMVNKSCSALVFPFDKLHEVKGLSLQWKISGQKPVNDKVKEKTKEGDDFPFRVGFFLPGEVSGFSFFLPSWIKDLSKIIKFPSDRIQNFVFGSHQTPLGEWQSPYSESISNLAVDSTASQKGWMSASLSLKKPFKSSGFWLMADGDNTSAKFDIEIRDFSITKNP